MSKAKQASTECEGCKDIRAALAELYNFIDRAESDNGALRGAHMALSYIWTEMAYWLTHNGEKLPDDLRKELCDVFMTSRDLPELASRAVMVAKGKWRRDLAETRIKVAQIESGALAA